MKHKLLILCLLTFSFANAQQVFQDDFTAYTAATNLSGQGTWTNNSSNPGGGGACAGVICSNSRVQNNTISYTNFGTSTKTIELKADADACGKGFTAISSGDVYVAMVINLSATTTSNNDFFRVLSGSNFSTTFRLAAKTSGTGFVVGTTKGGTPVYNTTALAYNQDHLIVLKYSIVSAGTSDDIVKLYVNPTFMSGEPAVADVTVNSGADTTGSIDRLQFRQNGTLLPTGRAGLVSVARSWSTLAFTPLATPEFDKSTFTIIGNAVANGTLGIKSNIALDKATLNIFDIQGRNIVNKTITLNESLNTIAINPIQNAGVYIVEIATENAKFTQKIAVQ